jgi:hypothetical protein
MIIGIELKTEIKALAAVVLEVIGVIVEAVVVVVAKCVPTNNNGVVSIDSSVGTIKINDC